MKQSIDMQVLVGKTSIFMDDFPLPCLNYQRVWEFDLHLPCWMFHSQLVDYRRVMISTRLLIVGELYPKKIIPSTPLSNNYIIISPLYPPAKARFRDGFPICRSDGLLVKDLREGYLAGLKKRTGSRSPSARAWLGSSSVKLA